MWDGSDYADTNSGSAAIAMVLEAYGYRAETGDVRALANILGRTFDVSQPPRIEMLARIGELSSVRGIGLYQGVRLSNWTADDVREKLRAGYPVLTLVRTDGPDTAGDLGAERFVVIVGLKDNNFVYHDPTYQDDRGAGRTLTERALVKAWASSSGSSQAVAFGLGQAQLGLFSPLEDLLEAQREPTRPTTNGMRDVPTPGPIQPLGPLSQLIPVPTPVPEEIQATPGSPIGAFHPLFLAFWAVAGVVAVKAVVSLLME
jgi:hypothetical protein